MADGGGGQKSFDRLVAELRPRLHRYCARMVGSAFDGEDVVQDALAKAYEALGAGELVERPEAWLFRIAHNTALDALRSRARRNRRAPEMAETSVEGADARVAATASLALFMQLPPGPRASVVLVDVLGHSLEETAEVLGVTLPSVKASLARGRMRLRALSAQAEPPPVAPAELGRLRAYAERFNARDFDALRALLAEDVRLDLVARVKLASRKEVSVYFTRYSEAADWRFAVGFAEGRPALLVSRPGDPAARPAYVVLLDWRDGEITGIRDFRYADYVMEGLEVAGV